MPHTPKIQDIDSETIVKKCALGIGSLVNSPKYSNINEMKEFKNNQDNQQKNTSLSKISGIMAFIGDILSYEFNGFLPKILSHSVHQSVDIKTKQFANIIAYTLTDYHCNCKHPMASNNNHKRTVFVEHTVPMFKYFAKETSLLGFSWCEKLVETQKYAQLAEVNYELSKVERKYADGLGIPNNYGSLSIESSSGIIQENVNHTLDDTLKLICECNGALLYILSQFNKSSFKTALERSTFGIQVIKNCITLSKMNLNDSLWKFVELLSAQVPTAWSDRFDWVKMFELLATLYLELIEQEKINNQIKKKRILDCSKLLQNKPCLLI